jgi:hypothetical protein
MLAQPLLGSLQLEKQLLPQKVQVLPLLSFATSSPVKPTLLPMAIRSRRETLGPPLSCVNVSQARPRR